MALIFGNNNANNLPGTINVDSIFGEGGNDLLSGLGGNDRLNGGLGNDVLNGGSGIDTADYSNGTVVDGIFLRFFTGATSGVTVNLNLAGAQNTGGAGTDILVSIENLRGTNFNDALTGNVSNNELSGLDGSDWIDGGSGNDALSGGNGNDVILGGLGHDHLNGGAGADSMYGGSSNDTLNGGLGKDVLTGGANGLFSGDTFDYNSASDSQPGALNRDVITDFNGGFALFGGDQIDLKDIDANSLVIGNQAFSWIGGAAFTAAGQLRYSTTTGLLQGSTDSDAAAEFEIQLVGAPALSVGGLGSDILL